MKWTLIGLTACAAMCGCDSSEQSEQEEGVTVPASPAEPEASIDPRDHPEWEAIVLNAVQEYQTQYGQVSGGSWITRLCRPVPPTTYAADELESDHAAEISALNKIGVLFARHAPEYLTDHAVSGSQVGQTIIKEAYEPELYDASEDVGGQLNGPDEARYIAGDKIGLFVMHRLDPNTAGTDDGWIYATLIRSYSESNPNSDGQVFFPMSWELTAVGKIDSCVQCHQAVDAGRLFGPGEHTFDEPLFNVPYGR